MTLDFSMYIYCPETGHYISSTGLTTTPDKNCVWESGLNFEKENSPFKIQQSIPPNHCFGIDSNNDPDFNYDCSKYSWLWNKSSKYLTCNKFYLGINNKNELFFDVKPSTTWELICPGTWQDWKNCTGNNCNCKQIKEYNCTSTTEHIWKEAEPQYKTDCQGSWSNWETCKDNKQTRTYIQNPKKCGLGTDCDIKTGKVQTNSCDSNQIMYYNNDLTLFFSEKKPNNVSGYLTYEKSFVSRIDPKFEVNFQLIQVINANNSKLQSNIRNNDEIFITYNNPTLGKLYLYNMTPLNSNIPVPLAWTNHLSFRLKFLIKANSDIQEIKKGTPFKLIPIFDNKQNYSIQVNIQQKNELVIFSNDYDKDTFFTFYDKDGIPPGPTPPGPTPPGPTPSQNHKTIIIVSSSIAAFVILCISLFLVFRKK